MAGVRVDVDGAVCTATLDEPDKLNPLGDEVRTGLHGLAERLADDLDVRVLVIRGAGRAFSAGADLRTSARLDDAWPARRRQAGAWQRVLDDLEALPQATVARLHGYVIGGAVLLAAACDLRVAADDMRLSIPEVELGIPLTWAGLPRLVREIGLPRTRDLVMTGRSITGAEAEAWGFATRVVPASDLDAATDALIAELLTMPDVPLRMTREALAALGRPVLSTAWADPDLLAWSLRETDTADAMRAYVERRMAKSDE